MGEGRRHGEWKGKGREEEELEEKFWQGRGDDRTEEKMGSKERIGRKGPRKKKEERESGN